MTPPNTPSKSPPEVTEAQMRKAARDHARAADVLARWRDQEFRRQTRQANEVISRMQARKRELRARGGAR